MLPWITGHIHPGGLLISQRHHSYPAGWWIFTHLWVFNRNGKGIQRIGIIDEQEIFNFCRIDLPISNAFTIGTPAKTIAAIKFFFVHPIKRTIDHPVGSIGSKCGNFPGGYIFHIQIMSAYISHVFPIWWNFCKHQRRCRLITSQLLQCISCRIQYPVITAGILSPHPLWISIDQHRFTINAEEKITDWQRLLHTRRSQLGRLY